LLLTDPRRPRSGAVRRTSFWAPSTPRSLFAEPTRCFYEDAAGAATRAGAPADADDRFLPITCRSPKNHPPALIVASARAVMTRTLPRRYFLERPGKRLVFMGRR